MQMRETGAFHKLCARNAPHQATVKLFRGSLRMLMNGKSPVWLAKGFTHSTKEIQTCCKKQKDHANALPRVAATWWLRKLGPEQCYATQYNVMQRNAMPNATRCGVQERSETVKPQRKLKTGGWKNRQSGV